MAVAELMTPALTAEPETPVREIALLMRKHDSGVVVLVRDERPVGVLTHRDLALALADSPYPSGAARLLASSPVVTVAAACEPADALARMTANEISHLAVVEDGRLAGMVARTRLEAAAAEGGGTPAVAGSI